MAGAARGASALHPPSSSRRSPRSPQRAGRGDGGWIQPGSFTNEFRSLMMFNGHIMWTCVYIGIFNIKHQGLITIFSGFIVSMIHQQSEEIMGALLRYVTDKKRIQPIDTGNRMGIRNMIQPTICVATN